MVNTVCAWITDVSNRSKHMLTLPCHLAVYLEMVTPKEMRVYVHQKNVYRNIYCIINHNSQERKKKKHQNRCLTTSK
jgi:hypothetical protein